MIKRSFDIVSSSIVLLLFSPFFLVIALLILLDSRGGVFFKQIRVGRNGKHFPLYKFRTMRPNSESKGQITVGKRDNRITPIGYFLRKFKLDEFPQLINVIRGDMSVVGPRPEVPRYVEMYTDEQKQVLTVRPGLTDFASLEYINENELLANAENPEEEYVERVMPAKLDLNLKYIAQQSILTDLKIIFKTLGRIVRI
jgi:lipopolysaccharide/colanic/teichoic acid biosynthesis glycosyltransferase